jgi:AbrB family looped-hinge helix DNA binding protein
MRTTIDKAGRVVVPKNLRVEIGLMPGEVEIIVDGNELRVRPVAEDQLVEVDGLLTVRAGDEPITTDEIRDLRLADQR